MEKKFSMKCCALALVSGLLSGGASAATVGGEEMTRLLVDAKKDGAVPVVIHLAPVSLDRLKNNSAATKAEMAKLSSRLLKELGAEALEGGRWDAGMGQMGLYVTEAGLRMLQASGNAISFWMGQKWGHQSAWNKSDGRYDEIDRRLGRDGYVEVDVLWNVDGLAYDIGYGNRPAYRMTAAHREEARTKAQAVLSRVAAKHVQNRAEALAALQSAPSTPETRLRLTREGLQTLLDNPEVRSVNPANFLDSRPLQFEQDAHEHAATYGTAEVIISLRDPMLGGMLSKNSENERKNANQRALEAILKTNGIAGKAQFIPGFGVVVVHASGAQLQTLSLSNDARIAAVQLNKPLGWASTAKSIPSLNIPQAWSKGYRAGGQYILVLDTGVEKTHPMFQAAGQSRISFESCFGTNATSNGITYQSVCPSANALGDSPVNTIGAGAPVSNCSSAAPAACWHGTHVAGIAAGTEWNSLKGVAPGATIVPIQVFSYDSKRVAAPVSFGADQLIALNTIYSSAAQGINNPFVVNMSLGGGLYSSKCDTVNSAMAQAISLLYSLGVPVIAAMGNDSNSGAISSPSCISKVIKVGSLVNNGALDTKASDSNVLNMSAFANEYAFMAPGQSITSAKVGGINGTLGGTSQATPHVAGFYAIAKAAVPTASLYAISEWFKGNSPRNVNGVPVIYMPNL